MGKMGIGSQERRERSPHSARRGKAFVPARRRRGVIKCGATQSAESVPEGRWKIAIQYSAAPAGAGSILSGVPGVALADSLHPRLMSAVPPGRQISCNTFNHNLGGGVGFNLGSNRKDQNSGDKPAQGKRAEGAELVEGARAPPRVNEEKGIAAPSGRNNTRPGPNRSRGGMLFGMLLGLPHLGGFSSLRELTTGRETSR